jgi:hypothetical protein
MLDAVGRNVEAERGGLIPTFPEQPARSPRTRSPSSIG